MKKLRRVQNAVSKSIPTKQVRKTHRMDTLKKAKEKKQKQEAVAKSLAWTKIEEKPKPKPEPVEYRDSYKIIKCPSCNGTGFAIEKEEYSFISRDRITSRCLICNRTGQLTITIKVKVHKTFVAAKRIKKDKDETIKA